MVAGEGRAGEIHRTVVIYRTAEIAVALTGSSGVVVGNQNRTDIGNGCGIMIADRTITGTVAVIETDLSAIQIQDGPIPVENRIGVTHRAAIHRINRSDGQSAFVVKGFFYGKRCGRSIDRAQEIQRTGCMVNRIGCSGKGRVGDICSPFVVDRTAAASACRVPGKSRAIDIHRPLVVDRATITAADDVSGKQH